MLRAELGIILSRNPEHHHSVSVSSKHEARLHQFGKQDASRNLHGIGITCGGAMVRRICSSRIAETSRTCQPQISTSNGSSTRKSHKKGKLLFTCANVSLKLFDHPQHPALRGRSTASPRVIRRLGIWRGWISDQTSLKSGTAKQGSEQGAPSSIAVVG